MKHLTNGSHKLTIKQFNTIERYGKCLVMIDWPTQNQRDLLYLFNGQYFTFSKVNGLFVDINKVPYIAHVSTREPKHLNTYLYLSTNKVGLLKTYY